MFPESAPQPNESRRFVQNYADASLEEIEHHEQEIRETQKEISDLEQRFHDINTKSLLGKVSALILGGVPEDGSLEALYKKLRLLEADPRFKKSSESIH